MRTIKWFYPGETLRVITGNGEIDIYVGEKDGINRTYDVIILSPDRLPSENKVIVREHSRGIAGRVIMSMLRLKTVKVKEKEG